MGFNFIVVSSINSLDGLDVLEFAIIKGSFNDISEINLDLAVLKIGNSSQSMFHPVFIISLGIIISGMSTSGFLSVFSSVHSLHSVNQKVLKFKGFTQISIPVQALVLDFNIVKLLIDIVHLGDTFLKKILDSEDSSMSLHGLLHGSSNLGGLLGSLSESDLVKSFNSVKTSFCRKFWLSLARLIQSTSSEGSGSTKDNQIEQTVGTQSIGTVDRGATSLTSSHQTWDDFILAGFILFNDFSQIVGWDTAHIVMDSRSDGNGLLGDISASENLGSLRNTWQSFVKKLRRKMV
mmetsp:Transcript_13092/g.11179  ORF Transcript_13092/g.11179 Transcript_13092/m.11179 type:complete len:292 (-) Transcript_13092:653-1528(-)